MASRPCNIRTESPVLHALVNNFIICIYLRVALRNESAKSVGRLFNVTDNHVYQINFRMRNLLRKHGSDCIRRALR